MMLTLADVAPELEDGFEGSSTSDAFANTQELRPDWLFPARWTSTSRASLRGAKKMIPRGSVAKLLLPREHIGGLPPIDQDHRWTRRGVEGVVRPDKRTRSTHRRGQSDRIKAGGRDEHDPKLTGDTPLERWRGARLRCRDGQDPALAGNTPLEKWRSARLRCSDQ
jgi:hypothetical protein